MNNKIDVVKMNLAEAIRKVKAIEELAIQRGTTGGLIKRIDENRELLELIQDRVPEFVSSHPWLVGWVEANDAFFTQLEGILETRKAQHMEEASPHEVNSRTQTAVPKTMPHVLFIVVVTVISTHFLTMLAFVPGFMGK